MKQGKPPAGFHLVNSTMSSPRQPPPPMAGYLRARIVLPLHGPPIQDGFVQIQRGRIVSTGRWSDLRSSSARRVTDLGEVVLLPGLVNAHCHLDYTSMAGQLVPPRSFTDWIKSITELKAGWSDADFAESWQLGARMLIETGTTTVGDIEAVPDLLPRMWEATPLRVVSFLEMTGVRSRRSPELILKEACDRIASLPSRGSRAGLSPHAPYSTTPHLLRLSGEKARQRHWRLTVHVAESREEFDMFTLRRGPMFSWLSQNERDMSDCGGISPVTHLLRAGVLGDNLLAIHVNYLRPGDASSLARHGAHVVHCPRSHAYFGHEPFPFEELSRQRVNVTIGTDSLATVLKGRRETVRLDMFAEMSAFANRHPGVRPSSILRMATVNGAKALGLAGEIGCITSGASADFVTIPFAGHQRQAYERVVLSPAEAGTVMIRGRWVHRSGSSPEASDSATPSGG